MKYFELGIFVIPGVCLIRKYVSQTQAFFYVFHFFFDTVNFLMKSCVKQGTFQLMTFEKFRNSRNLT